MRFERLSDLQGIGSNAVRQLFQDSRGFLWIVTDAGIDRYDGLRFKHYRLNDSQTDVDQPAFAIFEDQRGDLWTGGRNGELNRFDPDADSFRKVLNLPEAIAHLNILSFSAGEGDLLWIGTNRGLVRYDPITNRAEMFTPQRQPMIFSLVRDSLGQVWVGTANGLRLLDQGSGVFERIQVAPDDVPGERLIVSSLFDHHPSGLLFVGTDKGLFAVDKARRSWKAISSLIPLHLPPGTGGVSSIIELDDHRILAGVLGGGIALLDLNDSRLEWIKHNPKKGDSIVGDEVRTLLLDRSGVLWVGDYVAGLSKYSSAQHLFRLYRNDPFDDRTLSGNYIRGVNEAHDGKLWVCTQFDGLNLIDPISGDTKRYQSARGTLPYDGTYAVLEDRAGDVWVGMLANNGLARLDRKTDRFVRYPGIPPLNVTALYEDSERTLWVGTSGGVYEIREDRKTAVHHPEFLNLKPGTSADDIEALLVDSRGNIWIGLDSRLFTFVRSTGVLIDRSLDLGITTRETFVCGFLEAGDNIWIATKGTGVFRYDRNSDHLAKLTQINGLPHNNTYGILNDLKGRLWISTDAGIVRFDPATHSVVAFGPQHGLQGREFNRAAFGHSRNGTLYFGGTNGLNGFTPELMEVSEAKAPVAISGLSVNGVPMAVTSEIDLDYTKNTIAVELAVLDFNAPTLNLFQVKLEGSDDEWLMLGNEARVVFSHLQPGTYLLRVKGANSSGIWNEAISPMGIRIRSPWWWSGWALTIYVLLALLIIAGVGVTARYRSVTRLRLNELAVTAQTALTEKQLEEDRAKAKNELLASISHEIRTPLNAVLGMAHLLLSSSLNTKQKQYAMTIRAAGDALLALLNDVLDLSKIEAGALELDLQPFDIRECVEESVSLITYRAAEKDVDVRVSVDHDVPRIIVCDQNRLRQVLLNLLGNAVKFTDRGWVSIHVSASQDVVGGPGSYRLEFEISDTGIGISKDKLGDLFKAFSQVDNSATRRFGGTGLGLAISKRLTTAMGGDIEVESEVDTGSTFRAWIVAQAGSISALPVSLDARAEQLALETEVKRILVADDGEVNRYVIKQMLESLRMKAHCVSSGTQVIEATRLEQYDVVLMDVHMPDMDGIEVARKLRASPTNRPRRIIALTADVMSNTRNRCFEAGMDAVLTKPIEIEQLEQALSEVSLKPATSGGPPYAILNRERFDLVRRLSGGPQEHSFRAVDNTFFAECEDALNRLSGSFAQGAFEQVAELAHKLAGTVSSVGGDRMSAASRHVQACAFAHTRDSIQKSIDSLRLEYVQLRKELLRLNYRD